MMPLDDRLLKHFIDNTVLFSVQRPDRKYYSDKQRVIFLRLTKDAEKELYTNTTTHINKIEDFSSQETMADRLAKNRTMRTIVFEKKSEL